MTFILASHSIFGYFILFFYKLWRSFSIFIFEKKQTFCEPFLYVTKKVRHWFWFSKHISFHFCFYFCNCKRSFSRSFQVWDRKEWKDIRMCVSVETIDAFDGIRDRDTRLEKHHLKGRTGKSWQRNRYKWWKEKELEFDEKEFPERNQFLVYIYFSINLIDISFRHPFLFLLLNVHLSRFSLSIAMSLFVVQGERGMIEERLRWMINRLWIPRRKLEMRIDERDTHFWTWKLITKHTLKAEEMYK